MLGEAGKLLIKKVCHLKQVKSQYPVVLRKSHLTGGVLTPTCLTAILVHGVACAAGMTFPFWAYGIWNEVERR